MKIAIVGDLHIGVRNSNDVMLAHQKRFFNFFFEELKTRDISTVLQLGDLFDQRRQINLKALQFAQSSLFEPLRDMGVEFYTLVGNHDIFYRETLDIHSSGLLLKPYQNIHVVSEPSTFTFDGLTFDIVPWLCVDNSEECVKFIERSTSDYCLGHFNISSFVVLGNIRSDNGLSPTLFKNYKKVFSGHFHSKSEGYNIIYTGTPYELNWSDAPLSKGFYIFDTETESLEWVESPIRYYTQMVYDEDNKVFTKPLPEKVTDCFIKVIVKSKNEPFIYENYINGILKLKPADLKIVDGDLLEVTEDSNDTVNISDIPELIRNYIASLDTTEDEKGRLTDAMMSLYNDAMRENDVEED